MTTRVLQLLVNQTYFFSDNEYPCFKYAFVCILQTYKRLLWLTLKLFQ